MSVARGLSRGPTRGTARLLAVIGGDRATALAKAYESRMASEGSTLSATGYAAVREVFDAAADNGVSVASGWLFGSTPNTSGLTRIINLNASGPAMVPPAAGYDPLTNVTAGMVGVRCSATKGGPEGEVAGGLFENSSNYNVLCIATATGDVDGASQKFGYIYDQGTVVALISNTGSDQWYDNNVLSTLPIGVRDTTVQPMMHWVESLANGTRRIIHPGEEVATSFSAWSANPATAKVRIGAAYLGSDVGMCCLIRFNGVMSDAQRLDVFNRVYAAIRTYTKAAVVVGNSVTAGSIVGFHSHPHQLQVWGTHNNTLLVRHAEGSRRLPYFAPTGYTMPGGTSDSPIAGKPVNDLDWFAANLIINDEQQNAIANGQTWATFLHTHNAIVAYFAGLNTLPVRSVVCTFMPYAAFDTVPTNPTALTHAQVAASSRTLNRIASQAARLATSGDFNSIATVRADIYSGMNLGWDTPDDGNALDPVNDNPRGNPAYFPTTDNQHPNAAGHTKMYEIYRDAIIAVLA